MIAIVHSELFGCAVGVARGLVRPDGIVRDHDQLCDVQHGGQGTSCRRAPPAWRSRTLRCWPARTAWWQGWPPHRACSAWSRCPCGRSQPHRTTAAASSDCWYPLSRTGGASSSARLSR